MSMEKLECSVGVRTRTADSEGQILSAKAKLCACRAETKVTCTGPGVEPGNIVASIPRGRNSKRATTIFSYSWFGTRTNSRVATEASSGSRFASQEKSGRRQDRTPSLADIKVYKPPAPSTVPFTNSSTTSMASCPGPYPGKAVNPCGAPG